MVICYNKRYVDEKKTCKFILPSDLFVGAFAVPPTSVEIMGRSPNAKVEIKENKELELTCQVSNAKPKATIAWFKRDVPFTPGE